VREDGESLRRVSIIFRRHGPMAGGRILFHFPLIRPSDLHFGPPGTTSALEAFRVAQLERRMSEMPKDAHNKAAEHHENAAKSHKTAAEHHGKGDHAKGREESAKAHAHSKTAHEHSEMAHGKSQSQK
jgi:hypothetical protein